MRYVSLEEAEPGMQLAHSIFDEGGHLLLGGTSVLTTDYINRLDRLGFSGIYIEDELSKGIEISGVISPQLRAEGMDCIRNHNIDACHNVAKKIVEQIMEGGFLSLDLMDLRSYDDYTHAHSVNVAVICGVIGMGLKLDEKNLEMLVMAALLHDLGKLSIPLEILNKPGRLTQEEFATIKSHPAQSYEMIKERWDIPAQVKTAVLYHHENVDGSGYPQGIPGEDQTLFTRILHVADVYDALVSRRPYKAPYSPYEASEYLMGGCGIMFDYEVVKVLLEHVPLYPKGTKVRLSDGREAIIFENAGLHNLRPLLRLVTGEMLDLCEKENFSVTILSPEESESFSREQSELARKEMIKPIKRYKIAAVDDMKTNLQMLRSILEKQYDVTLLKSGAQALLYLEKQGFPDLILLDIDMPEMDGIETARRINALTGGKIPILFVTALTDRNTVMLCRQLHAAGYVVRPYNPVYIKGEIHRILIEWGVEEEC